VELHEGWRELHTLQTRPKAVKVWSLCYCCREVVPTSDGAWKKEYLYMFHAGIISLDPSSLSCIWKKKKKKSIQAFSFLLYNFEIKINMF
jgi:hypothetical protein